VTPAGGRIRGVGLDQKTLEYITKAAEAAGAVVGVVGVVLAAATKTGRATVKWLIKRFTKGPKPVVFVPAAAAYESFWCKGSRRGQPAVQLAARLVATNTTAKPIKLIRGEVLRHNHDSMYPFVESVLREGMLEQEETANVELVVFVSDANVTPGQPYVADLVFTDQLGRKHPVKRHRFRPM
jgi:hypothetical protein